MKIGFIGLGLMGQWMARNILASGHELTINDINQNTAKELISMGAEWADTPSELAAKSTLIFTSLPNPEIVTEVALGKNGILTGIKHGSSYFDLSTTDPDTIKEISHKASEKNVFVFDAPVSGGTIGAKEGTLCIMVGGDEQEYTKYKNILELMGNQTVYCGTVGSGAICKLVNNLIAMTLKVVLSEALSIGVKGGVPIMKLYETTSMSTGDTHILRTFPKGLFSGNFNPGFKLSLGAKDLGLAINLADSLGVPTKIADIVQEKFSEAMEKGWKDESTHSVAKLQEELSGILLRK